MIGTWNVERGRESQSSSSNIPELPAAPPLAPIGNSVFSHFDFHDFAPWTPPGDAAFPTPILDGTNGCGTHEHERGGVVLQAAIATEAPDSGAEVVCVGDAASSGDLAGSERGAGA